MSSGTVIGGRYRLEELVASGGMAAVWRATDEVLARTVAVKVLHPKLADDEAFLERFRHEALAAASLTHPNVVAIYDTGSDRGGDREQHYIVMEFCGDGTLAAALEAGGRFAPERAARVGSSICSALEYAHGCGIVHRDIKPANVLITPDDTVKVGDFGIAKAVASTEDITTTGIILGTVAYLSPEQARGLEPDPRSDLYSVGVVLYELIAGRPPFSGETPLATAMMHVEKEAASLRSIVPTVPRAFDTAIMRALSKDPDDRPQTAAEMRSELASFAGEPTGGGFERTQSIPVISRSSKATLSGELRWLVPVIALIAAAILAVILVPKLWVDTPGSSEPNDAPGNDAQIQVETAGDFDPGGGGEEHPELVGSAFDGDPATAWRTESYSTSFSQQKEGVGLVFDLGSTRAVSRVDVTADQGLAYELRASDEPPDAETDADLVEEVGSSAGTDKVEVEAEGRYWVLWITALPGADTGTASVFEVTFFGS